MSAIPTINLSFGDIAADGRRLPDGECRAPGTGTFPFTYTYQWKRCDAADPHNGQCIDIPGARSSFYTPVAADYGKRLRVQVTATNSQGSARQNSEVTRSVTAIAPKLRVTPQIFGDNTRRPDALARIGTWDGSTGARRSRTRGAAATRGDFASCVQIPGATTCDVHADGRGHRLLDPRVDHGHEPRRLRRRNHESHVSRSSTSSISRRRIDGAADDRRHARGRPAAHRLDRHRSTATCRSRTTFVWQRCDATGAHATRSPARRR